MGGNLSTWVPVHTTSGVPSFLLLNRSPPLPLRPRPVTPHYSPSPETTEPADTWSRVPLERENDKGQFLNASLFINLMQVYKIYCTLPNKSAMKNKLKKTKKKTKHAKCAAIHLLAIRRLRNSIMYSRFSLKFKEL